MALFRPQFAPIDDVDQLEQLSCVFAVVPNGECKAIEQCPVTEGFERKRCGHGSCYHGVSKSPGCHTMAVASKRALLALRRGVTSP